MRKEVFGSCTIYFGNNIEILPQIGMVDAIVTDPPYGIEFMGKKWDYDVPTVEQWEKCLDRLKPGGHLLSFAGTRTQHRMAINIEDAGFMIRDMLMWVYSQGFPKSTNISKNIDRMKGVERKVIGMTKGKGGENLNRLSRPDGNDKEASKGVGAYGRGAKQVTIDIPVTEPATPEAKQWDGWGSALKPSVEPLTLARKPFPGTLVDNVLEHGTGGLNIDGSRVAGNPETTRFDPSKHSHDGYRMNASGQDTAQTAKTKQGRWPANFIHDGSEEVTDLFSDTKSGMMKGGTKAAARDMEKSVCYSEYKGYATENDTYGDDGSAARFFYCAKSSTTERGAYNKHTTVKPLALMRYLITLITPPGGIILDPWVGSGSTGIAAYQLGMKFIGIETDKEEDTT